ncbi:MAG: YjjI family glycine radical enzyme [Tissierellia bacterium]|nr:YjjI family glycine radical enzyme [Tissierellia bacterium]
MERFFKIEDLQKSVKEVLQDPSLTYEQQTFRLAKLAENSLDYPVAKEDPFYDLYERGEICDLDEGHAPYAPRYVLPDYGKFLREGSKFLRLDPPKNLLEALSSLLILYRHVPSVTRFPVYIGSLDQLLEPFVQREDEAHARELIRWFLIQIDRTVNDSFCHGNIGPQETLTGRIILEEEMDLQNATPNLTLLYEEGVTPDAFAQKAVLSSLTCANPAFANHQAYQADFGDLDYGIASCYNALPLGGGAFTLSRLRLNKIAQGAESVEDFFEKRLPRAVQVLTHFMEKKIDFLVQESAFFKGNFLVQEGLIHLDNFVGLFGIVGLHEAVGHLMDLEGLEGVFGHDPEADQMGLRIMDRVKEEVAKFKTKYSPNMGHRFLLHAQVGAAGDQGTTPAHRIQIGQEPDLYSHIRQASLFQPYFPSGCGDHFPFDETAKNNPGAVLDVFKGAFQLGNRYVSAYNDDGDLIRVTGYLVKKSDVEAFNRGDQVSYDTVQYAKDPLLDYGVLKRKVEGV